MRIQIEPIPFGLDDQIVSIELQWGNKLVFSDEITLSILQFNSSNNFISTKDVKMTTSEYLAKGSSKEERIDNILNELNIVKVTENNNFE